MKRDAINKHGIMFNYSYEMGYNKKKTQFLLLKYYMQITITINSIPKKIKKGKNGVKQEDNNHKNSTSL